MRSICRSSATPALALTTPRWMNSVSTSSADVVSSRREGLSGGRDESSTDWDEGLRGGEEGRRGGRGREGEG